MEKKRRQKRVKKRRALTSSRGATTATQAKACKGKIDRPVALKDFLLAPCFLLPQLWASAAAAEHKRPPPTHPKKRKILGEL
ncbi:hypothetical protein psal_cds_1218 [Pandoravirus salinus]|uniref:Uncharacterized protein n=1 Tax=Pandoravirus salinus TaxID=1349410 RepID=S4W4A6_9VIRU|nr:hypothetical protein psal_cds_1218 [Pandoravirus salinus]AGO85527.2 hypothetical protein psal_cds_1218 [Pandoravirus salinus]